MKVYFLGIAGAGMSALASLLASEGHEVSGVDADVFPPMTDYLDRANIAWREGFDAGLVPAEVDVAIVGSSAKLRLADNPELAEIVRRGLPRYGFAEFLGQHTAARHNVVVAGSFGKSTITALLAHLMRGADKDPGYFVGAAPLDLALSGWGGGDPEFLVEGDEYIAGGGDRRSKFLFYHPAEVLLTSLVHDHLNVFPTFDSYVAPFAELLALAPPGAPLVCARGFAAIDRLVRGREVTWYGRGAGEGYSVERIEIGEVSRFDLALPGSGRIALATGLLGLHNIDNIAGAAALLLSTGRITPADLQRGVASFRGLERRLDKKTTTSRVPAYEGFGSSYEKARSAIEAVRLHFAGRSLVVVFEPHTFSWRDPSAVGWYDTVFAGAARVLLLAPPQHGAAADQLSQADIAERIVRSGVAVTPLASGAAVVDELAATLTGAEVILLLSSGPLGNLARTLPNWLDERFGAQP